MSVDNTRGHVYQKQSQEMVLGIETLVIARAALRERQTQQQEQWQKW